MRSNTNLVNTDENSHRTWERRKLWHVRRAIAHALILIGVGEEQSMDFWHEVNKFLVAAEYKGLFVPDPYLMTYEQVFAEVYTDIKAVLKDPRYQRYLEGCDRMHGAAERRQRA